MMEGGCERCVDCQGLRVGRGSEDWDEKSQEGARASESAAAAWYISNQEHWCTGSGGHKGGGVGRRWLQGSSGHEEKRKLKGRGRGGAACSVERSPLIMESYVGLLILYWSTSHLYRFTHT